MSNVYLLISAYSILQRVMHIIINTHKTTIIVIILLTIRKFILFAHGIELLAPQL